MTRQVKGKNSTKAEAPPPLDMAHSVHDVQNAASAQTTEPCARRQQAVCSSILPCSCSKTI